MHNSLEGKKGAQIGEIEGAHKRRKVHNSGGRSRVQQTARGRRVHNIWVGRVAQWEGGGHKRRERVHSRYDREILSEEGGGGGWWDGGEGVVECTISGSFANI